MHIVRQAQSGTPPVILGQVAFAHVPSALGNAVALLSVTQSKNLRFILRQDLTLLLQDPIEKIQFTQRPPAYHNPGNITHLFFLYFPPNSRLYLPSLFPAQTPICPTATAAKSSVLQLHVTPAIPNHASASNM